MRIIKQVISGVRRRLALLRFRRQLGTLEQREHTFFMIVMPGGLHVAVAAIAHFPKAYPLILIGNGFSQEENAWTRKHLSNFIYLPIGYKQNHFRVLDTLFSVWECDFGIIDYDCFVLDPALIDEITDIDRHSSMNGVYVSGRIPKIDTEIPETFILYFNIAALRQIMQRCGITSRKYQWNTLSTSLRIALNKIGLFENKMPDNKSYFDTLRLLMIMALINGFAPEFVSRYFDSEPLCNKARVFHVGSISNPLQFGDFYGLRGSYFWRMALERSNEPELARIGYDMFGTQSLTSFLKDHPGVEEKLGNDFLCYCNRVIETAFGKHKFKRKE